MISTRARTRLVGWPIVGWCSVIVVTLVGLVLVVRGTGAIGLRAAIRLTAQTSFVLFTSAFVASALQRAWPRPLSRWMLANRRYLGVSFAVSHVLHLAVILALTRVSPDFRVDPPTLVGGGLAYVFIAAMAATSFDRTAAWIGPRAWRRLHTAGVYYIWLIFFISYAPRAAVESIFYLPFALILFGALILRVAVRRRAGVAVVSLSS